VHYLLQRIHGTLVAAAPGPDAAPCDAAGQPLDAQRCREASETVDAV
jgi:hypothetical protein